MYVLVGGGGHARSVIEAAGDTMFGGYVAPEESPEPPGVPFLGTDEQLLSGNIDSNAAVHITVGIDHGCHLDIRRKVIDRFASFPAVTVIADHAVVSRHSHVGEGSAVMNGAIVNRATVGRHCVINTGAIVEHDCRLGDNVFVAPGAILCGEVTVGDNAFIGAGAVIRNGVSICAGASVAMGSVVIRNITKPGLYAGNPARYVPC